MTPPDWRSHRIGPLLSCLLCGRPALMRDAAGEPCHKTCAKILIERLNAHRHPQEVAA